MDSSTSKLDLCTFRGANSIPGDPGVGISSRPTCHFVPLSHPQGNSIEKRSKPFNTLRGFYWDYRAGDPVFTKRATKLYISEVLRENQPIQKGSSRTEQDSRGQYWGHALSAGCLRALHGESCWPTQVPPFTRRSGSSESSPGKDSKVRALLRKHVC